MAKLAALVPMPGINLTRFHGVFAPRHSCRDRIVRQNDRKQGNESDVKTEGERRAGMRWAQRLKRVLAEELLFGQLSNGGHVEVTIEKGKIRFRIQETSQPLPAVDNSPILGKK